jgi:hypothetical protein
VKLQSARDMSASPAIATELMPRAELTRCARNGLPQRQSSRTVRGTLVGSQRI